jgi:hypothetical protein
MFINFIFLFEMASQSSLLYTHLKNKLFCLPGCFVSSLSLSLSSSFVLVLLTARCSTLFKSREPFVSSDQTTIPGICFSELCLFEAQRGKSLFLNLLVVL